MTTPIAQCTVDATVRQSGSHPAYVRPRRDVLDGEGCIWEHLLAERGWNELTGDDKNGRIVAAYIDGTIDVYFDALDYTCNGVFPDEVSWVGHKSG